MTPLGQIIADEIDAGGPMLLSRYMDLCLAHPDHGYYRTRNPLGKAGDFITAPEISQIFGELIGLWAADLWQRAGQPDPVALVELGPGRGTLMADAVRAARSIPGFAASARVHFVETSPVLRAEQALKVPSARWHDKVEDLPGDVPAIIIANEFFDALPIDQFDAQGVARRVAKDSAGALCWSFADAAVAGQDCPAASAIVAALAARLGALLIIDYGDTQIVHDSFQAVAAHQMVDPLHRPGQCDLTAHVDFGALARSANAAGLKVAGPVTQGSFLRQLGLDVRTATLMRANPALAEPLARAAARLADPAQMGQLFKVLALYNPCWPMPAGFG